MFDIKSALEGRIQRAEEIANTLKHFKREVALAAEHSKSGKPIAQKLLADMETKGACVCRGGLGRGQWLLACASLSDTGLGALTGLRPVAAVFVVVVQSMPWRRRCSVCG